MNKKLLALAIGAAVAMPVAALADGPTLYGKINLSLNSVDDGNSTRVSVVDNASRLGVKGTADTSVDGVKGIYQAEYQLNADDGDTGGVAPATAATGKPTGVPISQRNIFAGVTGGFGTVLAGMIDTPLKSAQGTVDEFNDTQADMKFAVAGELRAPNVVAYASPKLGDAVTITVAAWQSDEATSQSGSGGGQSTSQFADATSASIVYSKDGLYAAVGVDTDIPGSLLVDPAGGFLNTVRGVLGYSTDSFELGLLYQTAEDAANAGPGGKDTSLLVSGAYKTGDWKLKAQYVSTDGDLTSDTRTETAAGVDYMLGKSTTIGATYALFQDDLWANDVTLLSVGIDQKF